MTAGLADSLDFLDSTRLVSWDKRFAFIDA
jgi:hypothetical protein